MARQNSENTAERKGGKKIQTRFSSRSLKNCNFFHFFFLFPPLVAHRASSKKGIKNEISASRAIKKKKKLFCCSRKWHDVVFSFFQELLLRRSIFLVNSTHLLNCLLPSVALCKDFIFSFFLLFASMGFRGVALLKIKILYWMQFLVDKFFFFSFDVFGFFVGCKCDRG